MKKDYLGKILSALTIIMFFGVFITVMTQIITRYLPISYSWTEELSRMFFVAAVCFGAPVAFRDYEFVIVDILIDHLPKKVRRHVDILINMAIIVLFIVIFRFGISLAINGHRQMSPTLGMPMSTVYALIPFSAVCFIYYALLNVIHLTKKDILKKEKEAN